MRRPAAFLVLAFGVLSSGCGGKFKLPSEAQTTGSGTSDHSYEMLQTWKGMYGIRDIVLTQGSGAQLFMVFTGWSPFTPEQKPVAPYDGSTWGSVVLFPPTKALPIGPPYFYPPKGLFNPIGVAVTGTRLYVLDQGDSCLARLDMFRTSADSLHVIPSCEADTFPRLAPPQPQPRPYIIRDYKAIWRVREYDLLGQLRKGDTLSTFTDTTFAQVYGIAADDEFIYVSGMAALLDTSRTNPQDRTRKFMSRIFRYTRGGGDINMPGASWHRDPYWFAIDGTGASSISDPRGIALGQQASSLQQLVVADKGNNAVKTISTRAFGVGYVRFDGRESGATFDSPEDVAGDASGYLYTVDRNNRRVLRYDPYGVYAQTVNVANNTDHLPLLDPVTVGVNDSMAYIGDRGRAEVIRYKRHP